MRGKKEIDQTLLTGVIEFLRSYQERELNQFRGSLKFSDPQWQPVPVTSLPASRFLTESLDWTSEETHGLLHLFERHQQECHWEQSYKKSDGVVSDAMLAGYGFVEVMGKNGPFVSDRMRIGLGVWGPHIAYPSHRHQAEELYVVLAGQATFQVGEKAPNVCQAGGCVYVPSMEVHSLETGKLPVVVLYIWQAGDLREISSFI